MESYGREVGVLYSLVVFLEATGVIEDFLVGGRGDVFDFSGG